jgi:hypothetical protein
MAYLQDTKHISVPEKSYPELLAFMKNGVNAVA